MKNRIPRKQKKRLKKSLSGCFLYMIKTKPGLAKHILNASPPFDLTCFLTKESTKKQDKQYEWNI